MMLKASPMLPKFCGQRLQARLFWSRQCPGLDSCVVSSQYIFIACVVKEQFMQCKAAVTQSHIMRSSLGENFGDGTRHSGDDSAC